MKKSYISLDLENIRNVPVLQRPVSHKRFRRSWRQLSSLQQNIILLIALMVAVSILYWFSHVYSLEIDEKLDEREWPFSNRKPNEPLNEPLGDLAESKVREGVEERIEEPVKSNEIVDSSSDIQIRFTFPRPDNARQRAVRNAVKHAWKGYRNYAWGHDHLKPISQSYQDWFYLGLTLVDSLDTLYMMNLEMEFMESREWLENQFTMDILRYDVNLFEVTIRVLGGLLSTYHFTNDGLFLDKATDLGERLMPCFMKSPSPIPFSDINLASLDAHAPAWSPDSSTAEVSTLQLEFRELSRVTKISRFEKVSFRVSEHIHQLRKIDGLVPVFVNPHTGLFNYDSDIKLGARGDSYYEYLLKQWIQTGRKIDFLKNDYIEAVDGILKNLVKVTPIRKLLYIGELRGRSQKFNPKMDHLTCYLPGTLALGVHFGMPDKHMKLAADLLETCYFMYADQPTFLSPEIVYFKSNEASSGPDMFVHLQDSHNLLRPEFIESLWMMYQLTGNETYQYWGWQVFEAIERYAKVADGYTSLGSVLDAENTRPRDLMESFFLSETLKYLYLLFSPDRKMLDANQYVMNSEGHPLPIDLTTTG